MFFFNQSMQLQDPSLFSQSIILTIKNRWFSRLLFCLHLFLYSHVSHRLLQISFSCNGPIVTCYLLFALLFAVCPFINHSGITSSLCSPSNTPLFCHVKELSFLINTFQHCHYMMLSNLASFAVLPSLAVSL